MTTIKKETVISSERVNCYGSRVLTAGIDITQYQRNPILLYNHERWGRQNMPIGIIENLRMEEDRLLGTPAFDMDDPDAAKIARKWEKGYLRMVSPSLEIVESSDTPELLLQGQTRPTVTKSKLIEVSVCDIGGNDDALQLQLEHQGKVLELSAGASSAVLPLLKLGNEAPTQEPPVNNSKNKKMETIFLALGLGRESTPEQAVAAVMALKAKADEVEVIRLAAITGAVDAAVAARRITADQKEHFLSLGKVVGVENLNKTLELMKPATKPMDVIALRGAKGDQMELKWGDLTPEKAEVLKKDEPQKYVELYRAEFGIAPEMTV